MNGNHFDIHDLKREYEKGRKQGAVEELERMKKILKEENYALLNLNIQQRKLGINEYLKKRLKELE